MTQTNKIKKIMVTLVALVAGIVTLLIHTPIQANQMGFTVRTIPSETQKDKQLSYFDLQTKPGETQTIQAELTNTTNKEMKIKVTAGQGTTNKNGVISYDPKKETDLDKTRPFLLSKIVTPKTQKITIPAGGKRTVSMTIYVPKKSFAGVVAGEVTFREMREKPRQVKGEKVAIQNEYQYITGLVLHGTKKAGADKLKLGDVWAHSDNGRNTISASIRNVQPKVMRNVKITGEVQTTNGRTMYKKTRENMKIAPNSALPYPIQTDGNKLKAGTYKYLATVKTDSKTWRFEKKFTISAEEAKRCNDKDVTIRDNYGPMIGFTVGVGAVLAGLGIWTLIKRRKN